MEPDVQTDFPMLQHINGIEVHETPLRFIKMKRSQKRIWEKRIFNSLLVVEPWSIDVQRGLFNFKFGRIHQISEIRFGRGIYG